MELKELYAVISDLDASSRDDLLRFIQGTSSTFSISTLHSRKEQLDNKQGCCPHCQSTKYVKSGIDKGSQRYKCKSCNRTFTEYTGTWLAGIVHKDKVEDYLQMMLEEKSLDKIKDKLKINKKTAFDWRHKILSAIEDSDDEPFSGITESDETFFKLSSKGKNTLERPSRKRGGKNKTKGVSNELVGVVVTSDRADNLDLRVATIGRLTKQAIIRSIGNKINSETILCSDGHVSYKGFAIDNELEHHVLRGDLKQRVKQGVFHIQNVNSIHNRLKKWIDNVFWGVSTKYLQKYLNWFRLKEKLKKSANLIQAFAKYVNTSQNALARYKTIDYQYLKLIT